MTKERKMAVRQWEKVIRRLKKGRDFEKPYPPGGVAWYKNCWLCQYLRKRSTLGFGQGCDRCPLYQYERRLHHVGTGDCGCDEYKNTLFSKAADENDVEAAEQILRFIKYGYREVERACEQALECSGEGEQVR